MPQPGRRGRPREVEFREVINAVRYLVRLDFLLAFDTRASRGITRSRRDGFSLRSVLIKTAAPLPELTHDPIFQREWRCTTFCGILLLEIRLSLALVRGDRARRPRARLRPAERVKIDPTVRQNHQGTDLTCGRTLRAARFLAKKLFPKLLGLLEQGGG